MSEAAVSFLLGAVAMASLVAALFFLRFWRQTGDRFFLLFAVAFAVEGLSRFVLRMIEVSRSSSDMEPFFYIPRLLTFALIFIAIVRKNWPPKGKGD